MKITLKESLEGLDFLYKMAKTRMEEGTKKYGEGNEVSPFTELVEEVADAFNYLTMLIVKLRRRLND